MIVIGEEITIGGGVPILVPSDGHVYVPVDMEAGLTIAASQMKRISIEDIRNNQHEIHNIDDFIAGI